MMQLLVWRCVITVALAFVLFTPGPEAVHGESGTTGIKKFTKHFEQSLFTVTGHAFYSMEVLLDDKEYKIGKDVIGIVVHNAHDEDVKGAELIIVHKNLSTGENAPGTVTVADKGNGLYLVSGLDLQTEGRWELAITVKKDGVEDRANFVLADALKERVPKGRFSP